jgi:hypothetical protein
MTVPLLVINNGPIGVGKTAAAIAVAGLVEAQGHRAAADAPRPIRTTAGTGLVSAIGCVSTTTAPRH